MYQMLQQFGGEASLTGCDDPLYDQLLSESAAQTGTVSTGMGNMGGPGGQKPDGALPSGGGPKPDDDTPRSKPTGEMPQKDSGNAKA